MARLVGRISGWNDAKGYGFVVPHDAAGRAFVHVKALQPGSRRPMEGDMISYEVWIDARGRQNAREIRLAGQRKLDTVLQAPPARWREPLPPKSKPLPARLPGLPILAIFSIAITTGAVLGFVPFPLVLVYCGASVLSFLMYWMDKSAANWGERRIPEASLHLVDLLGGWPGALLAQAAFRHKTVKASFQQAFRRIILVNLSVAVVASVLADAG